MPSLKILWGMVSKNLKNFLEQQQSRVPYIRPRKRKGKITTAISSLPEEIQVDIFLKLPLKSIGICRCVCKVWCSLLCNPRFIRIHLSHTKKHKNNCRLMLTATENNEIVFCSIDYASISSVSSPASSSTCTCHGTIIRNYPFKDITGKFGVLGSCDGLIFIGVSGIRSSIEIDYNLCIWNPSTGEYKNARLPQCNFFAESDIGFIGYGFCYDCIVDDYKLVRISINKNSDCYQVEVCTVGSELWKTTIQSNYTLGGQIYSRRILNGAIHCLGFKKIKETSSKVIVSFDMRSEKFVDFIFPEEVIPSNCENSVLHDFLEVMNDCLYLVTYCPSIPNSIHVWKMQDYGVRESWTKLFTLTTNLITNIEYLRLQWSFASGEFLIICDKEYFLYDPKNDQTKGFEIHGVDFKRTSPQDHVESLVTPNSGSYVRGESLL